MLAENMTSLMTSKRGSVSGSGQRSSLTTIASDVPCSPAYPDANGQLQERLRLQTPVLLYRSFVQGTPDVKLGDTVQITGDNGLGVSATVEYRARGVAPYGEGLSAVMPAFTEVILEKVVSA